MQTSVDSFCWRRLIKKKGQNLPFLGVSVYRESVWVGVLREKEICLINSLLSGSPPSLIINIPWLSSWQWPQIFLIFMMDWEMETDGQRGRERVKERDSLAWFCSICEQIKPIDLGNISGFSFLSSMRAYILPRPAFPCDLGQIDRVTMTWELQLASLL